MVSPGESAKKPEPARGIDYHQFDVHIAHACNFSCESCSHYSNYHFSGVLSLATAEEWYRQWSPRLRPFRINLLGGEPAINPKLSEHVTLARQYWPKTKIYLYTNGFLLAKHPRLPEAIKQAGNFEVKLSRHYNSAEYMEEFDRAVALLQSWREQYGIRYSTTDSYNKWTRRYMDEGGRLVPFQDGDPRASWELCNAKYCLQLHEGKLWKCPILAYLPMVEGKLKLDEAWGHCRSYQPLTPDCSESELHEFLARREESYCGACPAHKRPFPKNDPTRKPARPVPAAPTPS